MAYRSVINSLRDGELVDSGTTNRPLHELQQNVDYLKNLFEAAFLGQAVVARGQIVEPDAMVGQAVYFNEANSRFERALFAVETDETTGELVPADSSQVWGLVLSKTSSTAADVVLAGMVSLDPTYLIGGGQSAEAGVWYLSSVEPGRLIHSRSPAGVPVLVMGGETSAGLRQVHVRPDVRDPLNGHRHYRFELQCRPAGDHIPPDIGEPHEITSPDSTREGWLPADDDIFDGKAPAGAKFGYNISQSGFRDLWPPVPLLGAELVLSRGEDEQILGCSVPNGENQPLILDENGIWWMVDCYGQVPWPIDWGQENSGSLDSECPILPPMSAILWWTRMTFFSAISAVLSLRPKAGSGLRIYCRSDGEDAETGHLEIDLDLDFSGAGDDESGHLVFKSVDGRTFSRGPVVESVRSGSSNVTVSSDQDTLSGGKKVGNLVISVTDQTNGVEYPVTTVKLNRTTLEFHDDVLTYGFSDAHQSEIRGEIALPTSVEIPEGGRMKLTCLVVGRAAGTVADDVFAASYRRIPFPANATPVALPTLDTEIGFSAGATLASGDLYYRAESEEFEVETGDTIQFTINRTGSDGYAADLLMFRLRGQLVTD